VKRKLKTEREITPEERSLYNRAKKSHGLFQVNISSSNVEKPKR
jgi:hypothetical protein